MNLSISDIERDNLHDQDITAVIGDSGIAFGNRTLPYFEICDPYCCGSNSEGNGILRLYGTCDKGTGLERSYVQFEISKNNVCDIGVFAMHDAELVLRLPAGVRIRRERRSPSFSDAKSVIAIENENTATLRVVFYGRCEIKGRKIRLFSGRSWIKLSFADGKLLEKHKELLPLSYNKEGAVRLFLSECAKGEGDALEDNVFSAFLMAKDILFGRFTEQRLLSHAEGERLLLENRYMKAFGIKPDRKRACLARESILFDTDLDSDEKMELLRLNAHALTLSEKKAIIKAI